VARSLEDKQLDDLCDFLSVEWRGTRRHSYLVPNREKSSAWSQSLLDGVWSAVGLKDALCSNTIGMGSKVAPTCHAQGQTNWIASRQCVPGIRGALPARERRSHHGTRCRKTSARCHPRYFW
jgi:hypothetical protein